MRATLNQEPDLFTPRVLAATADPKAATASDVAWFVKLLEGAGCWMTAKDILLSIARVKPDGSVHDDDKRWLRSLASATDWVLSGQKGYLHCHTPAPKKSTTPPTGSKARPKRWATGPARSAATPTKYLPPEP